MTEREPAAGATEPRSVLATDLVGREHELGALDAAVRAARDGRGGVVIVRGEAGIGKSRLARATADDARARGVTVMWGRAVPSVAPVAYRPVAEALSAAVRLGIAPDPLDLGPYRSPLARLVADWRDEAPGDVVDSQLVVAEGVVRFLRWVAGDHGALLVLEDLHWADPETLSVVEFLADNLAAERVLCLATVRDDTPSDAADLVRVLDARRAAPCIELRPLDDAAVARMLGSCLGVHEPSPALTALAARAEGVPFLLEELLAVAATAGALVHDGDAWELEAATDLVVPLTFADSVRRRVTALGPDARPVLAAAAILGRRFDWELLPPVTGLHPDEVEAALHAAVAAQLVAVEPADRAFRFRHALSRDAVLADLLPPERTRLSDRALAAVERRHPGLPGEWCELAAGIAEGGGDPTRAAALLLEAGRRALAAGALATAEVTLVRARALARHDHRSALDVDECLVEVLALAGKYDRAVDVGEALLVRLGGGDGPAPRRAATQVRLARAAVAATRWSDADTHVAAARSEASGTDLGDALRATVDVVAAQVAILRDPDEAEDLARRALDVALRRDLPEVACEALEIIGRLERAHDLDAAEAAFARARDLAHAHGRAVWRMRALHELGTVRMLRDGDVRLLEQARELSLDLGAPATTAVVDVQIGAVGAMRDDPEPGIAVCRRAADAARRHHLDQALAAALAFEAFGLARAGRAADAERCLAEASALGADQPEVGYNLAFARAHVAWMAEDRAAAVHALLQHTVIATAAVGVETTGPNRGVLALLLAVDGDDGAAMHWLDPPPVHFLARAYAAYAEAVVVGRAGDATTAMARIARGDEDLRDFSWYRAYGHRLVADAALADGWGEPGQWLLGALDVFAASGADAIASACRSRLRTAGVAVPRRRGEAAASEELRALGVTAREAEVLHLLGEGLSNRAIGERLYLSPRTVERHVASLTAKVGVDRRAQLVAFAARAADRA